MSLLAAAGSGGTNIILILGAVGGAGALIGAVLTYVRGRKTDRYGIYSQAFKDLTSDIERVRLEAEADRKRAREREGDLTERITQLENRITDQEQEIIRLRRELSRAMGTSREKELTDRIAELQGQLTAQNRELTKLRRQAKADRGQLKSRRSTVGEIGHNMGAKDE